jgi:hypothetical protein
MTCHLVPGNYRLIVFWKTQNHGRVAPHNCFGYAGVTTHLVIEGLLPACRDTDMMSGM